MKIKLNKLSQDQKDLRRRILEINYQKGWSHIGSCLSTVDLITAIYKIKQPQERFILSSGHAAVALYAVLEKEKIITPADTKTLLVHPDRNKRLGIDVSTGSLGQGLPIAVGMALSNRKRRVFCIISDGECAEGSIWEALRIGRENQLNNLKIILNASGRSLYDRLNLNRLYHSLKGFGYQPIRTNGHNIKKIMAGLKKQTKKYPRLIFAYTQSKQLPFLSGLKGHSHRMDKDQYELGIELFK